jgi:Fe-S-cluster containining protein
VDELVNLELQASELCQACGLCCNGLIFNHAVLKPGEAGPAARLGLSVYLEHDLEAGDYEAFQLPCPCYKDHKCAIYIQRPDACRHYQCLLLRRFLQGKYSFEVSLDLIQTAKRLIGNIQRLIGAGQPAPRLWDQVKAFYEKQDAQTDLTEIQIEVKTLWNFCYYQFDHRVAATEYPDRKKQEA